MSFLFWSQPKRLAKSSEDIDSIKRLAAIVHAERNRRGIAISLLSRLTVLGETPIQNLQQSLKALRRPEIPLPPNSYSSATDEGLSHALRHIIAPLEAAACEGNGAALFCTLPSATVASIAAVLTAEAARVQIEASTRIAAFSAETELLLKKRVSSASLSRAVARRLATLSADPHLSIADVGHLTLSPRQGLQLARLVSMSSNLVVLNLAHCFLGDQLICHDMLPSLNNHQRIRFLSLAGNALSIGAGPTILQWVTNPDVPVSLCIMPLDDNDLAPSDVETIASVFRLRHPTDAALDTLRPSATPSHRKTLVLEGGGMAALAQVQWLHQQEELAQDAKSRATQENMFHLGQEFDTIIASSFGAVIACALALRIPLSDVRRFFEEIRRNVFETGVHNSLYYVETLSRAGRRWWTQGNYYEPSGIEAALKNLFGDAVFDFGRRTKVIIVLAEAASDAPLGRPVIASSQMTDSIGLRHADIIPHAAGSRGQAPLSDSMHFNRPLVRHVVMASMAGSSLFSPCAVQHCVSPDPCTGVVDRRFFDAVHVEPHPVWFAVAESLSYRGHSKIISLGFETDANNQAPTASMAAAQASLAALLESATDSQSYTSVYDHMHEATRARARSSYQNVCTSGSIDIEYHRVGALLSAASGMAYDESDYFILAMLLDTVMQSTTPLLPST